jgi:hypothetical protein
VWRPDNAAVFSSRSPAMQALLAGFFLSAVRYQTTEYDKLKANDTGTHIYRPVQHVPLQGVRLAIDERSVLDGVRPQWLVFVSCQQAGSGLWRMTDLLATDAASLQAAAPFVYEWTDASAALS